METKNNKPRIIKLIAAGRQRNKHISVLRRDPAFKTRLGTKLSYLLGRQLGNALLAQTGDGYLLAQARAQEFRNGFFDQSAQLWNQAGSLLATSHQIVYYKE